jgi:hypothetical protein
MKLIISNLPEYPGFRKDSLKTFVVLILLKKFTLFFRFYFEVFVVLLYYALVVIVIFLKRDYFQNYIKSHGCANITVSYSKLSDECACAYRDPKDSSKYVSFKSRHTFIYFCKYDNTKFYLKK